MSAFAPIAIKLLSYSNGRNGPARDSCIATEAQKRKAASRPPFRLSSHREFPMESCGDDYAFPSTLSFSVLTRSFAVQPSRSYSAIHFSANCFRRTSVPAAIAPNNA